MTPIGSTRAPERWHANCFLVCTPQRNDQKGMQAMSLEERLQALAKKGELVHLSIAAARDDGFRVTYAAASEFGRQGR